MKTLLEILQSSEKYLAQRGYPSPRVDAEWLISHALGLKERLQLYIQFERPMREEELAAIRPLLRRRGEGEPLQYILGTTGFYNCDLQVGPGVLVPRPETERLVEIALERYEEGDILDLCTGSGAILLALAAELAGKLPALPSVMVGVDSSEDALAWATRNRASLGYDQVDFRVGDLWDAVPDQRFGLITANPPYVTLEEFEGLPVDVRDHEPRQALVADDHGLSIIKRILERGGDYLTDGAWLVMEIGERQGATVLELMAATGWKEPQLVQDYNHRDRLAIARH